MSEFVPTILTVAATIAAVYQQYWLAAILIAAAAAYNTFVLADASKPDYDAFARAASSNSRGHLINTCDTQEPLKLIYGTCRVGINRVYAAVSGDDNRYLHIVGTVGEGEVNGIHQEGGIDQVFLNDKLHTEYGSLVYYEFFTGSSTQNVCATLAAACPEWNDPLRYTAYIYVRLEYDQNMFQGLPDITLIVEGLKCYNPSTEVTEYTDNPALAAREYKTRSSRCGGMQISASRIDDDSVAGSAAYCVTKGWTIGLPIYVRQAAIDNLKPILACFRGAVIYSENLFKMKYRDLNYESTVMDLDEDDIVETDESSLKISQPSIFGTPNAVRMKFLNSEKKYQTDDYVKPDSAAIASEGDLREEEISILGVNTYANAMILANYWLERLRINKKVSLRGRARCMELEAFDLIRLSYAAYGWINKTFRIEAAGLSPDGTVTIEAQEEDGDFYNDTYDMETHNWHDTNLPSPSDTVPSVINVSHAEEVYYYRGRSFTRWKIDFDPPAATTYPFWDHAQVWVKIGDDGDWKYMTKAESDYMLDPVEEGKKYYVRLVSVSIWGTKQAFDDGYTVSKTILGKTSLPSSLTSLTAVASNDVVNLMATPLADPDIVGYEVRLGSAWSGGLFIGFNETPNLRLAGVRPGTHTFWMAAKDNAGHYSETPRSATVTVFYPANYSEKNSWSWDFTTGSHENTMHTIYDTEDCLRCAHGDPDTWDLADSDMSDYSGDGWSAAIAPVYGKYSLTSGMLTQSGLISFSAANAVDGDTGTNAWHTDSSTPGAYLLIDLGAGNEANFTKCRIYVSAADYPGNYSIQYSDDGSSFNSAATGFVPSSAGWNEKTWTSVGKHRYWRLYLTNTPGSGPWWQTELELYDRALVTQETDYVLLEPGSNATSKYCALTQDLGSIPSEFTVEVELQHDALGYLGSADRCDIEIHDGVHYVHLAFDRSGFYAYSATGWQLVGSGLVKYGGSAERQTWRFVITMGGTMDVYLHDSTHDWELIASDVDIDRAYSGTDGMFALYQYGYTSDNMRTRAYGIKVQTGHIPPPVNLVGTWTSPEYDLGSKKKVRVWGDFRSSFTASGLTWDGLISAGQTWNDVLPAGMTWVDFFAAVAAGNIQAVIKWGDSPGSLTHEADYFHILAPEFEAQYVQAEITITDPASDAILYLRELNMKGYFWE